MSLPVWCLLFAANALWFVWMVSWGGAEWLEQHVHWFEEQEWTADELKSFARFEVAFVTIWFVVGIFEPGARGFYLPSPLDE